MRLSAALGFFALLFHGVLSSADNACHRYSESSFEGATAYEVFQECMMCFSHAECTPKVVTWCMAKECDLSLGCGVFSYKDGSKTIGCKSSDKIEEKVIPDKKLITQKPKPAPIGKQASQPTKSPSRDETATGTVSPTSNQSDDLRICSNLRSRAVQCCNDPESCAGDNGSMGALRTAISGASAGSTDQNSQQGLREYCQQMQASGNDATKYNARLANACYEAYIACQSTCEGMANVNGDSSFSSIALQCGQLSSKMAVIGQQGFNMSQAGSVGDLCAQISQASPQSVGGVDNSVSPYDQQARNANDPYGCQTNPSNPACIQCTSDPSHPLCKGLTNNKMAEGQAGFGGPENTGTPSDFNVGSLADAGGLNDSFLGAGLQAASPGSTIPTKTIPNNSGGMLPLPGDGGGRPARLDAPSRGGGGGGRPSVNTDIEQGFRSGGGGYSYASGASTGPDGGEAHQGHSGRRNLATDDGGMTGLDLRKYLPGGALDPARRAGGLRPANREINGPGVDIFERITQRIHEKCRLGYLLDCH
jgi:hypothetical protein